MLERLLERISVSRYQQNFVLKGGMLVASVVGVQARSTMDMDTVVKHLSVTVDNIRRVMTEVIEIEREDGVVFEITQVSSMMEDAEYSGIRVKMEALFDGMRIPLKVDITTGNPIVPEEILYYYKPLFGEGYINIYAYRIVTVLAEKAETILSRDVANTRMRDFYDVYILLQLNRADIRTEEFVDALRQTMENRKTIHLLPQAERILDDLNTSALMQSRWTAYQNKYEYAKSVDWVQVIEAVGMLLEQRVQC